MKLKDLVEKYGNREVKEGFDIEKYLEPATKVFLPEVGDRYYYLDDCLLVCSNIWGFEECRDSMRYECGNCFRTDREAAEIAEEFKLLQKMRTLGAREEFIVDKENWFLDWSNIDNRIDKDYCEDYTTGHKLYFDTEEDCRNAIEEIGEEKLKKYYFKVKEF